MKFTIGDKIILLHSGETGTVTDYINDEMVMVEVEGIVFPVYADQIDFPYFQQFSEKKEKPEKTFPRSGKMIPPEQKQTISRPETGVWLSFFPVYPGSGEDDTVQELKIYLVNETKRVYRFHYRLYTGKELFLEITNAVPGFADFYLNDLLFEQLNDNPVFNFIFSLEETDPQLEPEFNKIFRPKARQVFQKLEATRDRKDASFRFLLFERYPRHHLPEKIDFGGAGFTGYKGSHRKRGDLPEGFTAKYEVDLHIEKITSDWRHLSNFEILTIQLHEFQKYLDRAIAQQQHSMVAIHGVGKGKLREEIHQILRRTPEVRNFVNQYDIRYGYGATEIFFKI